jgi:nitroreductase
MLNDCTSLLSLLATRRSGRPRELVEPGPTARELRQILEIAMRTPDHGKLAPWKFIHIPRTGREAFAELLHDALREEGGEPRQGELDLAAKFAHQAPELIVALSTPQAGHKVPVWEQQLSCGAACMNLLTAAAALGYSAGWVTGWMAYSPRVLAAFGTPGDRIAGFIFIGTPSVPLEERPRPVYDEVVLEWPAKPEPAGADG